MTGLHLTADLYGCRCDSHWMTDAARLEPWCIAAVASAGLRAVNQLFHASAAPGGVSATVLLAQSHLCLHTWPEKKTVTLDVFVSNHSGDDSAKARGLMDALIARFEPEWTEQRSLDRGEEA